MPPEGRPPVPRRPRFQPPWVLTSLTASFMVAAGSLLLAALPLAAAPDPSLPPPPETFRNLQLITLACGRENTESSCAKARSLADPLLDHPRLSARCKDVLWTIRQKATVAPANSLARRDPIDQAAKDVTVFCRRPVTPSTAKPTGASAGQAPMGTP